MMAFKLEIFKGEREMENGVVVKWLGPLNYLVKMGNGMKKVHIGHILPNRVTDNDLTEKGTTDDWDSLPFQIPPTEESPTSNDSPSASSSDNAETRRYPQRAR